MSEGYAVKVRPEKAEAVEKIRAELEASQAAVITEYRGLTVQQLAELRTKLLTTDSSYTVSKNTLVRRAVNALGLGELEELLVGPTAVVYVKGDPIAAAKIISSFAKEFPALVIKGGVLEGRVLTEAETKGLATVDSLDVSRAKIAGMLVAPLQQLVMLLEAPTARILFVLDELARRGGVDTSAPAEAEAEVPAEAAAEAPAEAEAEAPAAAADAGAEATAEAPAEAEASAEVSASPEAEAEAPTAEAPTAEAPAEEAPATEETPDAGSTEEGAQS